MSSDTLRVGFVGLGANCRLRHVPGLLACRDVEITAVANRRMESTLAAAAEFGIARTFDDPRKLVADTEVDAVVIGTWPYMHCELSIAALEAGKHVLTEARMAASADEARRMLEASRARPELVAQIVPSPLGLRADRVVKQLLADGYLGTLREVVVLGMNNAVADPAAPLHWRQVRKYSGVNMLTLGILHETLTRWVPPPSRVTAAGHVFNATRPDPEHEGQTVPVDLPDSLRVLAELPGGAVATYHLSGAVHFGPGAQIHLYGSEGTLKYELAPHDRLVGARRGDMELAEIPVPDDLADGWRVEEEFVAAIRGEGSIEFTDFATGVAYMEFTEAVARSIESGQPVGVASIA